MNCLYFACPACCVYVDAGYRWAYWLLESRGLVTLNESVDVEAVLNCAEYWNPRDEERSPWLMNRILPAVRRFFDEHRTHGIVYIDEDTVIKEDTLYFNWTKIEE